MSRVPATPVGANSPPPSDSKVSSEIDARERWLVAGITDYFRGSIKSDKLQRFVKSDQFLAALHDFADLPETRFMAFEEAGTSIALHLQPPGKLRGRCFFYVKSVPGVLRQDDYAAQVLCGDVTSDNLMHLTDVSQQIYMPLLSNPENQGMWSEVVSKDIMERLHTFIDPLSTI